MMALARPRRWLGGLSSVTLGAPDVAGDLQGQPELTALVVDRDLVAPARVDGDRDVARHVAQGGVHLLGVEPGQPLRIVAELLDLLADLRIAHHRYRGVVDLEIRAAGLAQRADLRPVRGRQVRPKL